MTPTAQVRQAFQRSIFVMTSAAAIVLAVAEGAWFPSALTPLFAALTWYYVDHTSTFRLGVRGANTFGVIAFLVMAAEFSGGTLLTKVFAGAHLLTWMTWVVLLLRKGIRQYWWLVVLAVLQVCVAAVLTDSPVFGISLAGMLLIMIWTLSLFTLYRIQLRTGNQAGDVEDTLNVADQDDSGISVRNGIQLDSAEPWIGWRIRSITAFSFFSSLVIGTITFLVFPRLWVDQQFTVMAELQRELPKQTGFTDEVELGDLGTIMQSDVRVLQVRFARRRGREEISPEEFCEAMNMDELMLRGSILCQYRDGRWANGARRRQGTGDTEQSLVQMPGAYRVEIIHDPPVGTYLFAPTPATSFRLRSHPGAIAQRRLSYSFIYNLKNQKARSEQIKTVIECVPPTSQLEFHSPRTWNTSRSEERDARVVCLTPNLEDDLPLLYQLAQQLSEDGNLEAPELARRIYAHPHV